jgi:hypothetical protein
MSRSGIHCSPQFMQMIRIEWTVELPGELRPTEETSPLPTQSDPHHVASLKAVVSIYGEILLAYRDSFQSSGPQNLSQSISMKLLQTSIDDKFSKKMNPPQGPNIGIEWRISCMISAGFRSTRTSRTMFRLASKQSSRNRPV